jgi:cbb3-type cytochrome oxidase subunit 3
MRITTFNLIFSGLCLLAIIAVATGAALEIARTRRGESIISTNQFRLRMLSSLVWIATLGSLAYATLYLWPAPGDSVTARRFLSLVSGAILLFFIGLFLLAYDVWLVNRGRRQQEKQFQQHLDALAQEEIERALQQKSAETSRTSDSV